MRDFCEAQEEPVCVFRMASALWLFHCLLPLYFSRAAFFMLFRRTRAFIVARSVSLLTGWRQKYKNKQNTTRTACACAPALMTFRRRLICLVISVLSSFSFFICARERQKSRWKGQSGGYSVLMKRCCGGSYVFFLTLTLLSTLFWL